MVLVEKIKAGHLAIKNSAIIRGINAFLVTPYALVLLGALTVASFMFSKELVLYTVAIAYAAYVGLYGEDFAPIIPLFVVCYIVPSKKNNPGLSEGGLFYGQSGTYIICLGVIAAVIILARIALDKGMGYKNLFTRKRELASGMLLLGLTYFISGLGSEKHLEVLKSNLLFALIQFVSIFFLYFVLTSTVKWKKFNAEYFAWVGVMMGVIVTLEIIWIYYTDGVITNGVINRGLIYSGWGCYNNMGALVTMSVPFAFYFACRRRLSVPYLILAVLLTIGVFLSCSRGSMVGVVAIFPFCFIYAYARAKHKTQFRLTMILVGLLALAAFILYGEEIFKLFEKVPSIVEIENGNIKFNDSRRFDLYYNGIRAFIEDPIFGQSFFTKVENFAHFASVDSFNSFFPPRWHNTIVQLLATGGVVCLVAYGIHRIQTIRLYFRRRSVMNTYIAFSIISLLCMSMLDCHMFNVGPVLFYSAALAVMEKGVAKRAPWDETGMTEWKISEAALDAAMQNSDC